MVRRWMPSIPTVYVSATKARVIGNPDMGTVSTSIVERANLDIRSRVRRFTRLTNGYSKKAKNHAHAFSLYAMVYNFCWVHGTLSEEHGINTTPAMTTGLEAGRGRYWRWWRGWTRRGWCSRASRGCAFP